MGDSSSHQEWLIKLECLISAAVERSIHDALVHSTPESVDETARHRTMWFGEKGRRRIELAEEKARSDPKWADKMSRRHAEWADKVALSLPATCSTVCPSDDTRATAYTPTVCAEHGMATVASVQIMPVSSPAACIVRDDALRLEAPTKCSTGCFGCDTAAPADSAASAGVLMTVPASPTVSYTTRGVASMDSIAITMPPARCSMPDPDPNGGCVDAVTESLLSAEELQAVPTSSSAHDTDLVIVPHTTCSTLCADGDTDAAVSVVFDLDLTISAHTSCSMIGNTLTIDSSAPVLPHIPSNSVQHVLKELPQNSTVFIWPALLLCDERSLWSPLPSLHVMVPRLPSLQFVTPELHQPWPPPVQAPFGVWCPYLESAIGDFISMLQSVEVAFCGWTHVTAMDEDSIPRVTCNPSLIWWFNDGCVFLNLSSQFQWAIAWYLGYSVSGNKSNGLTSTVTRVLTSLTNTYGSASFQWTIAWLFSSQCHVLFAVSTEILLSSRSLQFATGDTISFLQWDPGAQVFSTRDRLSAQEQECSVVFTCGASKLQGRFVYQEEVPCSFETGKFQICLVPFAGREPGLSLVFLVIAPTQCTFISKCAAYLLLGSSCSCSFLLAFQHFPWQTAWLFISRGLAIDSRHRVSPCGSEFFQLEIAWSQPPGGSVGDHVLKGKQNSIVLDVYYGPTYKIYRAVMKGSYCLNLVNESNHSLVPTWVQFINFPLIPVARRLLPEKQHYIVTSLPCQASYKLMYTCLLTWRSTEGSEQFQWQIAWSLTLTCSVVYTVNAHIIEILILAWGHCLEIGYCGLQFTSTTTRVMTQDAQLFGSEYFHWEIAWSLNLGCIRYTGHFPRETWQDVLHMVFWLPSVLGALSIHGQTASTWCNWVNLATMEALQIACDPARLLGFDDHIPAYAGASNDQLLSGVNFASAAAGIRDETGQQLGQRISFGGQLQNYQAAVEQLVNILGDEDSAANHLSQCIFTVGMGSNDYLNNYFMPTVYSTSRQYTPEQYADVLIDQYSQQLRILYNNGARKVALMGVGQVGCSPNELAQQSPNGVTCVEQINSAIETSTRRWSTSSISSTRCLGRTSPTSTPTGSSRTS